MAQYDFITLSGTVVADTSLTKEEVEAEQKAIFGDDVDLSDESPNGVLVNSEVISRNGIAENNAKLANQQNPNFSGGVFLDAVWALTSGTTGGRRSATYSTVDSVDLTGVPGTVIPSGAVAVSAGGDEFGSVSDVTLDSSGLGSVSFKAVNTGAISVAVGDLNSIAPGAPLGWETVNNTSSAVLGSDQESDAAGRQRRLDTMALQGISVSEAVTSAIMNISGVKSLSYRENYTKSDATIDGIFLLANSVFTCVDGGLDEDIAQALVDNKTCGANWNGSVSAIVTDESSGQPYTVVFERPAEINVWVKVTIAETSISDPTGVINDAVLKYIAGEIDGEKGYGVGRNVSPFEIASAVNSESPGIFIKNVELSTDGSIYNSTEIAIALDEVPRTTTSQIYTVIA